MPTTDPTAKAWLHRAIRRDAVLFAILLFVASIILRASHSPAWTTTVVTPHTWMIPVVFAAYCHGWLKRDRPPILEENDDAND